MNINRLPSFSTKDFSFPRSFLIEESEATCNVTDKLTTGNKRSDIDEISKKMATAKKMISSKSDIKRFPDLCQVKLKNEIDEILESNRKPDRERDEKILKACVYYARNSEDMQQYKDLLYSEKTKISFTCPATDKHNFAQIGEMIDKYSVIYPDILDLCEKLPKTTFYRWTSAQIKEKECADGIIDYNEVKNRNYDNAVFVSADPRSSREYGDAREKYLLDPDTRLLNCNNDSNYYNNFDNILNKHNLKKNQFIFPHYMAIKSGVQMIRDNTLFGDYPWFKILDLNVIRKVY